MISFAKQSRNGVYGLNDFVVDVDNEVEKIVLGNSIQGSSAYVIETGDTYILNGKYQWILQPKNSSGSGSGAGSSGGESDIVVIKSLEDIENGGKPSGENEVPIIKL